MSIEKKMPHASDFQKEDSISAQQNPHRNSSFRKRMKEVGNAMVWFPWKGVVRFLYWMFQESISLPQAVRDMEEGPDFVPSKRYLENEFKKYARLHNAARAVKNSEPLTPALKRVLEEAIHVTGTYMDSIRERQQVREKELDWLDLVPEYMHMEDVFPDAP